MFIVFNTHVKSVGKNIVELPAISTIETRTQIAVRLTVAARQVYMIWPGELFVDQAG